MPNLIVLNGLRRGTVVSLGDETTIGRGSKVDVRLPDHLVSTQHAKVVRADGAYRVHDLGSTNSTFCNGLRVEPSSILEFGDVLQVGTTDMVFTEHTSLRDLQENPPEDPTPRQRTSDSPLTGTLILPVIQRVERRITQAPDLDTFLARLAHELAKRIGARGVHVVLRRRSGLQVALRVALPEGRDVKRLEEGQGFKVKPSLIQRALDGSTGAVLADADGFRACCLGLPHGDRMIGVVYLHDVPDDLTEDSLEPLVDLAGLAGVHCQTHVLVTELKEQNAKLQFAQAQLTQLNEELQTGLAARTEELGRSERSYRELFEDSRDGNLTVDRKGRILAINRAAAKVLEVDAEEVVGTSIWTAFQAPLTTAILALTSDEPIKLGVTDTQRFRFNLDSLARNPNPDLLEVPYRVSQGERILELLVRPLVGRDVDGVHAVLRDVTARREAELQRSLLARVVENVPEAVVSMTLEGEVTSWNPGAESLYGYTEAEVRGQALPTVPDGRGEEFEEILQSVVQGETRILRTERVDRHDRTIPVLVTFAPVPDPDGKHVGVVEMARDLTGQLELEERMRWGERMASFGELAAGLAHELGNPLASLRGGVDYLLDKTSDPEPRESLELLQSEMERLQGLVQRALDLARWEPPELAPVSVGALLEHVSSLIREQAAGQGVEVVLQHTDGPPVLGEEDQLKQALLNLTTNALQVMPDGGRLELEVLDEEGRRGFRVSDTGPGIAPEDRERIFHLFFSRRAGGTGIGLAIVKRIVDMHQGEITVESGPDGSTFEVSLPIKRVPAGD